MSHESAEEIRKHTRIYIGVFVALLALTMITVGVSYLNLSLLGSVLLALFIATIKGSLVACFFMHLISEKKLIYYALILTVIFFAFLIGGPLLTDVDKLGVR